MDIDGPPATSSTSRASTSTSTPRPSSAGVKLPGIRTLPGFQIAQHESASGSGLGSSSGRDREWNGIREREAARDREALREMEWERQRENEWRERERVREGVRGFEPGIGSGTGFSNIRKERELSLPMAAPVSRPFAMSSSPGSVVGMSMTQMDDRPLSRVYTSSATLNSILSVAGPSEPLSYRPVSSASRSLSSPSPFAHGVGAGGLPPIGHGLRRKGIGGMSGETTAGGGGTSGGIWAAPGQSMSPPLSARSPSVSTPSVGTSSLSHLYAAAAASGPYAASPTASTSGASIASTSRPPSSHASSSSPLGLNGYGYGRTRTDSNASVNTHISITTSASGSLTPTNHHRMPMPISPPATALSHPRPQHSYAAPPLPHRAVMSPPPLPPSRQQQPQSYRMMSPPAPATTPVLTRGNENPYLAARNAQPSPTYTRLPQVEGRRMERVSPPRGHVQPSPPPRVEVQSAPASPPPNLTKEMGLSDSMMDDRGMAEETREEDGIRDTLEKPMSEEASGMEMDAGTQATTGEFFSLSRSRVETTAPVSASLEVPNLLTPKTRPDTLRPPSSSPLPQISASLPGAEPSVITPLTRVPFLPSVPAASSSDASAAGHSHPASLPSPAQRPSQDALISPPDMLVTDDSIQCVCGISIDDGFSIACDVCSRWCHTACFKIGQESVPEEWVCWMCAGRSPNPNGHTAVAGGGGRGKGRGKGKGTAGTAGRQWTPWTKEEVEERRVWARAMQMEKLGLMEAPGGGWVRAGLEAGGIMAPPVDIPGTTGKRKRRASALQPFQQQHQPEGVSVSIPAPDGPATNGVDGSLSAVAGGAAGSASGVVAEEEDEEPWTSTYVSITQDVITDPETRARLRRHAQRWRGVSALVHDGDNVMDVDGATDASQTQRPVHVETMPDPDSPNVIVRPLAPFSRGGNEYATDGAGPSTSTPDPNSMPTPTLPPSAQNTLASASFAYNPLVLPPSYSLHTTSSIPSKALIAPFVSHITPSSTYLADPLNAYVHLGMPKPYVHLLGPPLEVALDARGVGGKARFARRGCRPNAVVRPVLCDKGQAVASKKGKERQTSNDGESEEDDGTQLAFGVFALRDLKAGEEVVLGWEWDDGHVVHKLPALLQTPSLVSPMQVPHIKGQMANLLHALASNFVSCACGAKVQLGEGCTGRHDRDDERQPADRRHEYGDDHHYDAEAGVGDPYVQEAQRGRTRERISVREKRMRQKEKRQACALASMARFVGNDDRHHEHSHSQYRSYGAGAMEEVDLGPLVGPGVKRGVRTREGQFGGVENVRSGHGRQQGERRIRSREMDWHGRGYDWQQDHGVGYADERNMQGSNKGDYTRTQGIDIVQEPWPPDPRSRHRSKPLAVANGSTDDEARMPPKMRMRKRWTEMHEITNADASVKQPTAAVSTSKAAGPMDVDDEVLSVTENGRIGLGITFERMAIPVAGRDPSSTSAPAASPAVAIDESPSSTSSSSQILMPPPPLPIPLAAVAPTPTVSGPVSSSGLHSAWSNGVPRSPPRSPGSPIVVPCPSLPRRTSASSDGETQTSGPTPPPSNSTLSALSQGALAAAAPTNSPSPLVSFANLSLLSPAVLNQVRMQLQTPNAASATLQVTPDPLLSAAPSLSSASYFPADAATLTPAPVIAPEARPHVESSPSSFSLNQMDLSHSAPHSPGDAAKDNKDWSPLQRRAAQSFPQMDENLRVPLSGTNPSSEPVPQPSPVDSPLLPSKKLDETFADDTHRVAPSKDLSPTERCEAGVRVEYSVPPELSATHAPCIEKAERRSLSPDVIDIHIHTPNENARSRSKTPPTLVMGEPAMEVDVETPPEHGPELVLVQREADKDRQSDESDDIDFPSRRWRRKRKRVVSMDSEAGAQSPPYKVARDSTMLGVSVHTSPRPQHEQNEALSSTLAEQIAVNGDAVMEHPPADDSATNNGTPDTQEIDGMTIDETVPISVMGVSASENTAASVSSESAVLALPDSTVAPVPEPSPPPEAPRKVKLSLADFARRKKQQRQEEERQLEMQKALTPQPPPPAASMLPPAAHVIVVEPPPIAGSNEIAGHIDTEESTSEPQQRSIPPPETSSAMLPIVAFPILKNAPILDTTAVEPTSVNGSSHEDPSPAPSPMSVSPEETAPPLIKFALPLPTEESNSPTLSGLSPSALPELEPLVTRTPIESSSARVNGTIPKPTPLDEPATAPATQASSFTPTLDQASDEPDRQAKQERIEAVIPPPPFSKPSRFGPPLTRSLVGLVVHPPAAKPVTPSPAPGHVALANQHSPASSSAQEKLTLPPHVRRQSQTQEDGEIRENVPPASQAPGPQPSKHTWSGQPLPDPPSDPKDLKGWNQYYRRVYNLTGSFDPPGVAVRPGIHPPPKGPRSLNPKGENAGNVNGNSVGQTSPLVPGAQSRASLPIPTGPRLGVRPGARAPIPDDATRAAMAKAKIDAVPPVLASASAAAHPQPPPVTLGPPPLSARIGPPVPRGSSVDYVERDRDDSDRRGGRDHRPYARGRGRGNGGVWRK